MADLSAWKMMAYPCASGATVTVETSFFAGFVKIQLECTDDHYNWFPLPDTIPATLPPGGTAIWFDPEPTRDRWYRVRVGEQFCAPVRIKTPKPVDA